MDSDRPPPSQPPHRTTSSTSSASDLFICFTSRHHSMKISSKTILSPGRTTTTTTPRDPPFSLTTSLSRRLRNNRSVKGGASPAMFPGKKRGSGFENQEPSSPKVTCIGQVRIKTKKKQGKRLRSLSRRHSTGDISFRKLERGFGKSTNLGAKYGGSSSFGSNQENLNEQRNSQRWVHLPLTICEALRAFGSEFSCLFPCRSSCFSPATEKDESRAGKTETSGSCSGSGVGSCAAVVTRWLMAVNDGDDGGGRRDIELVVEDGTGNGNGIGNENDLIEGYEERGIRASRRHVFEDLEIVNDRIEGGKDESRLSICIPPKNALLLMRCRSDPLKMEALANRLWQSTVSQSNFDHDESDECDECDEDEIQVQQDLCDFKECKANNQEDNNDIQEIKSDEKEEQEEDEMSFFGSLFDEMMDEEIDVTNELFEDVGEISETEEKVDQKEESKPLESELETEGLPECLLLMMYEPKLSMEVSRETWVSSKDFIRRQPSKKKPPPLPPSSLPLSVGSVKPTDARSKVSAASSVAATAATAGLGLPTTSRCDKLVAGTGRIQPGRSSCSLPAPTSMAEMLEQKLVNAVGYEPFVLTRCKSEPMRTAAGKIAPDNQFWKNRKLEPLRRASYGVGAAGIGV